MAGKYAIEMLEDRIESPPLVDAGAFDILLLLDIIDTIYAFYI